MISTFLGWFLYTQYYASLPLFVSEGLHRPDLLSSLFVLNTILICVQLPLSRMLLHFRLPTSQGVFLAFLSFSAGYVLLWLFSFWQMVYVAVVLWTLGEMLLIPALDTQVAEGALLHQRHVAFTLNSMIIGCGEGLGNLAGVSIMSWFLRSDGIQNFYLVFFLIALGATGILILSGNPRESLIIRKFRGLSSIPTGRTDTLPPLFSSASKERSVQTTLSRLSEASSFYEEEWSPLKRDSFSERGNEDIVHEGQQSETLLSLPAKSISAADISSMPTLRLAPISMFSEALYSLPCGHKPHKLDARYCSVCGASAHQLWEKQQRDAHRT
jgi:MFS family permease